MAIPYPLNNEPGSPQNSAANEPQADTPVKPFRAPAPKTKALSFDPLVLLTLYNDNSELKRSLIYGLLAVAIIAGSILAKTTFTYASLALMVISVFGLALVNTWSAIFLFIVYLSLEGMYKYTSAFNPVVYMMAPILSVSIFVAWRLRTRTEAEHKEAQKYKAPVKASLFQKREGLSNVGLPRVALLIFALVFLSFLQVANPNSPGVENSLSGAIVWYIGPMSFFFVTYYSLDYRKEAMGFIYTLLVTGFVISAYAVFQFNMGRDWVYAHVPGMENMAFADYRIGEGKSIEIGAYRPAATAAIAGGYVVISCMAILASLCVATLPRMATWRRTLSLLSMSVTAMGLVAAGVRQVVLNLVVVIPVLIWFTIRRFEDAIRIYFMMFVVAALLATSFIIADTTAEGKLSKRYGGVFTSNPIQSYAQNRGGSLSILGQSIASRPFGIGINRTTAGGAESNAAIRGKKLFFLFDRETQFNAVQLDLGILGLISLAALYIVLVYQGASVCRKLTDPNLRSIAGFMYTVILFNVIASFGSTPLLSNYIFWSACGILYALPRVEATERKILIDSANSAAEKVGTPQRLLV